MSSDMEGKMRTPHDTWGPFVPREFGYIWRAIETAPEGATRVYAKAEFERLLDDGRAPRTTSARKG